MKFNKIKGLVAAPFTPFLNNGDLNLSMIPPYARNLKENRVSGVFIGGTTGEGMLMTVEERIALAEAWIKHRSDTFKIIIHVGANSYRDACELARQANQIKADAISTMGPLFLKPQDLDDLIRYCQKIVECADEIPFYYYHIPGISGVHFPMIDFLEKCEERLPALAGIKYSHGDLLDLNLCLQFSEGKWDILYGQDETLLAGLAMGIEGAVGSTYNYLAPLYHKVLNSFREGNIVESRKFQYLAAKFVRHLIQYGGGVIAGKPLMKSVGLDCGPLRAPAANLSDEDIYAFHQDIHNLGIDKYFHSKTSLVED